MTRAAPTPSRLRRMLGFPLTRIVVGVFAVALAVGLATSAVSAHVAGPARTTLPNLAGAAAALLAYWTWVRLTERREVEELSARAAVPELAAGLALGAVMVGAVVGTAALTGAYTVVRVRDWDSRLLVPYLLTRHLWLCIGIHVAWNYTLGTVFSVAVSGRESRGWVEGTLRGAGWVTGGAYGLEASVITLVVLLLVGGLLLQAAARAGSVRPYPGPKRGVAAYEEADAANANEGEAEGDQDRPRLAGVYPDGLRT